MSEIKVHNEALTRMIGHLVEKQGILRDLLRYTLLQKELLQEKEEGLPVEAFTDLLAERGMLMERTDHLDEAFLKEFSALKSSLGVESLDNLALGMLDFALAEQLQEQVKKVQELVTGLHQVDKDNRSAMNEQMQALKTEINNLQQGKKAIHGYANTKQQQPSIFIDKKEEGFKKKST